MQISLNSLIYFGISHSTVLPHSNGWLSIDFVYTSSVTQILSAILTFFNEEMKVHKFSKTYRSLILIRMIVTDSGHIAQPMSLNQICFDGMNYTAITKKHPCNILKFSTVVKIIIFEKELRYFSYVFLKHRSLVHVRTASLRRF